jgi:hypothetical protein
MITGAEKRAPPVFQAGWSCGINFYLSLFVSFVLIWDFRVSFCSSEGSIPYRSSALMSLSGEGRYLCCCARHFRTANSAPLTSICRSLAPFGKLSWEVTTLKCTQMFLFQSSAPVHFWAPERSRTEISFIIYCCLKFLLPMFVLVVFSCCQKIRDGPSFCFGDAPRAA